MRRTHVYIAAVVMTVLSTAIGRSAPAPQSSSALPREASVMPQYDSSGALRLPETYRQWVFVGSSLGLSYSEGTNTSEMFGETLMEPTAYHEFVRTGKFREGTMFVLMAHGAAEGAVPARHGRFAAELHGVEMAVKDTSHRPEGWAYYAFGGSNGIRAAAQAMPKDTCYTCHADHAKRDNVFVQFYPLLLDAAHLTLETTPSSAPGR